MKRIKVKAQEVEVDLTFLSWLKYYGFEYKVIAEDREEINTKWPPTVDNILF